MIRIDPAQRGALIEHFRSAPFGPHTPEMQKILQRLRWGGAPGRAAVAVTVPYREWAVATTPVERGQPVVLEDERYDDIGDAMVAVFIRRLDEVLEAQEGPPGLRATAATTPRGATR